MRHQREASSRGANSANTGGAGLLDRLARYGRFGAVIFGVSLAAGCEDDSTGPVVEAADTVALPDSLFDGNGYMWDVFGQGAIGDGTNDAYDGGLTLSVDATGFGVFTEGIALQNGREIQIGPDTLSGLEVSRRVFVSGDRAFARFLEVLVNRGTSPVTAQVTVTVNLGSNGATVLVSTSDFDATFEATDRWVVSDDADGTGDPSLAHVTAGAGGAIGVASVTSPLGNLTYTYSVTVAAGARAIVMHFASQNPNRDTALRTATSLAALGVVGALDGMSSTDLAAVVNWDLTP